MAVRRQLKIMDISLLEIFHLPLRIELDVNFEHRLNEAVLIHLGLCGSVVVGLIKGLETI